jgi:hypothetical protein
VPEIVTPKGSRKRLPIATSSQSPVTFRSLNDKIQERSKRKKQLSKDNLGLKPVNLGFPV